MKGVLITTLTIKMSEDLSDYLKNMGLKVAYLHSEIKSLERIQIIQDLRKGKYDVLVGINLLREGLDLPEVSLVAILDADKQGFLRSERSLIQTIGRAARNVNGKVIMYADKISKAMEYAIKETERRRKLQIEYNEFHRLSPKTVKKEIREEINIKKVLDVSKKTNKNNKVNNEKILEELKMAMNKAAEKLDFETAAQLRDLIIEMKK